MGILAGAIAGNEIESITPMEANASDIFQNNILVGASMLFIGAITGGAYSCAALVVNGYLVGKLLRFLFAEEMYASFVTGLMPHLGIEMLGLLCFASVAFVPACELRSWLLNGRTHSTIKELALSIGAIMLLGTGLLFVAAVVESRISVV